MASDQKSHRNIHRSHAHAHGGKSDHSHQDDHKHGGHPEHDHDHHDHGHGHDDHHHDEDHGHSHGHHHHLPAQGFERAFLIGISLNLVYVVAEVVFGIISHSLALVADAGHNFSDVVGLVLAWAAIALSKRKPSNKYTYGLKRTSILASLANAVLLLISVGVILLEAIKKLITPSIVESDTVIWVAAVGIIINLLTALMFMRGRKGDLNVRSAFTHMAADAVLALGVVITGVAIHFTGLNILDPLMGILISMVIVYGTWGLMSESLNLAVDAVPEKIKHAEVKSYLASLAGVHEVHDLHIWGISTTDVALTAHLVLKPNEKINSLLAKIDQDLKHDFGIGHSTIQCEYVEGEFVCTLKSDEVI